MNIYREVFKCICENAGENVVSRVVFMNRFCVFVPKQGHFLDCAIFGNKESLTQGLVPSLHSKSKNLALAPEISY